MVKSGIHISKTEKACCNSQVNKESPCEGKINLISDDGVMGLEESHSQMNGNVKVAGG